MRLVRARLRWATVAALLLAACTGAEEPAGEIPPAADAATAAAVGAAVAPGLCVPDPDAAPLTEADLGPWVSVSTGSVTTWAQENSTAHRDLAEAHRAVLDALAHVTELLETPFDGPLDVYLYENPGVMAAALGYPPGYEPLGSTDGTTVHEVCGGPAGDSAWVNMAANAHEIAHVVTLQGWPGAAPSSFHLIEGVATYAMVGMADTIIKEFRRAPAPRLWLDFSMLAPPPDLEPDLDEYRTQRSLGAVLTKYLIEERGGVARYRELWLATDALKDGLLFGGALPAGVLLGEAIEEVYGTPAETLLAEMREHYGLLPPPPAPPPQPTPLIR